MDTEPPSPQGEGQARQIPRREVWRERQQGRRRGGGGGEQHSSAAADDEVEVMGERTREERNAMLREDAVAVDSESD